MDWFEMSVSYPRDPKFRPLRAKLKNPLAECYVLRLYAYCYEHERDHFHGEDVVAIIEEDACCWKGKTGALLSALIECGFIDRVGPELVVHGVRRRLEGALKRRADAQARWERFKDKHNAHPRPVANALPTDTANALPTHNPNARPPSLPPSQVTTTGADAPALALEPPPAPKPKRAGVAELEALEADLSAAYREAKGEELDWPKSAHGELAAIRKALADDAEVLRRWRLFLATEFWPIKSVHKFREAFQHARFQKGSPAADPKPIYPSIPVYS